MTFFLPSVLALLVALTAPTLGLFLTPENAFTPAAIPLAVRSPYMHVWHNNTRGLQSPSSSWPTFWTESGTDWGWRGKIQVDGKVYNWLGGDNNVPNANITSMQITPTRTIYQMQAGPMNLTVTFLSPVEPSDWVKQSFPFSYLTLEMSPLDGDSHIVQVYSDITAVQWLSGVPANPATWSNKATGSSVFHEIELQNPQAFTESGERAQDGKAYYAMLSAPGMSWQIGISPDVNEQFASMAKLTNQAIDNTGSYSQDFLVFGFALELGSGTTFPPTTWAVGYVRSPSILYTTASGEKQERVPYFATQYPDVATGIDAFLTDAQAAHARAVALDQKITGEAAAISGYYSDLVSLATRQTMGSLDITVPTNADGNVDPSDVKIFMKDIGTSQRVNPVERMYAALPAFLYLNASMVGPLLAPLLELQDNSTQPYAAQDLGLSYPVASGIRGAHPQGIEQTGNMLIMLYAHARTSGDGTLVAQHYDLVKRWADYLVANSLMPDANQMSADSETIANSTNLALKGILGVKAMAEISRALNHIDDAAVYDSNATALQSAWETLAVASGNDQAIFKEAYSMNDTFSYSLEYNVYADQLLDTNVVSTDLLSEMMDSYQFLLRTNILGPSIDSASGGTISASWVLLVSAFMTNETIRNEYIEYVWIRAASNFTVGPFPDLYDGTYGDTSGGTASPALGAMYSHLALTVPNTTIVIRSGELNSGTTNGRRHSLGPILGGAIGGPIVFVAALFTSGMLCVKRRRGRLAREDVSEKIDMLESPRQRPLVLPYFYPGEEGEGHSSPAASPSPSPSDDRHPREPIATEETGALLLATSPRTPCIPSVSDRYTAPTTVSVPYAVALTHSSAKAQEAAQESRLYAANAGASDIASTVEALASGVPDDDPFRQPANEVSRTLDRSVSSTSRSTTRTKDVAVAGLRIEVEKLRREISAIRAERPEPPPGYVEDES